MKGKQQQITSTGLSVRQKVARAALFASGVVAMAAVGFWQYQKQQTSASAMQEMLSVASREDKLGLVIFSTDYCYPCDQLQQAMQGEEVKTVLSDHYVPITTDVYQSDMGRELARTYKVKAFPCVVVLDSEGAEVKRLDQPGDWKKLDRVLRKFAELREAPIATPDTPESAPAELEPVGETVKPGERVGVELDLFSNYKDARRMAGIRSREWKGQIWIHPDAKGKFHLVAGMFSGKKEAMATLRMMKLWDGFEGKMVKLQEGAVIYPILP